MKITKRQLRRIIREEIIREDENTNEAKNLAIDAAEKTARLAVEAYFGALNMPLMGPTIKKLRPAAESAIEALVDIVKDSGIVPEEMKPFLDISKSMIVEAMKSKSNANELIDFIVLIAKSAEVEIDSSKAQEIIDKAAEIGIKITDKIRKKLPL